MTYKAYYYLKSNGRSPLEEYLKGIKDIRILTATKILIEDLIDSECKLPSPFIKPVTNKIYELRLVQHGNQIRIFYFIVERGKIILLDGCTKKTHRIPKRILNRVQKYYLDYLAHYNGRIYIRKDL